MVVVAVIVAVVIAVVIVVTVAIDAAISFGLCAGCLQTQPTKSQRSESFLHQLGIHGVAPNQLR